MEYIIKLIFKDYLGEPVYVVMMLTHSMRSSNTAAQD
jgi:hypothetical protein